MDSISRPDKRPAQPALQSHQRQVILASEPTKYMPTGTQAKPLDGAVDPEFAAAAAARDHMTGTPAHDANTVSNNLLVSSRNWWSRPHTFVIAGLGLAVIGSVATYAALSQPELPHTTPVAIIQATPTPVPTPITKPSSLTGLPIDPALASRPVYGVMVENLAGLGGARPQSGLSDAGVVYEALAEGGITRFLALFADGAPKSIGPVRSLRPYYIDWAMEYGAALAHAGGSSDALNLMQSIPGTRDVNALNIGAPTFYRTNDRLAPHNLYTNDALMSALVARLGYGGTPNLTPTPRQADNKSLAPSHPKIHIDFSTTDYAADYLYDAPSNAYARRVGGQPHIDRNTGAQIMVKNIVVEYMPITYTPAPHNSQYINMPTIGSGKALVFRDGDVISGTWAKPARTEHTRLLDDTDQEIKLNAGNTWYEIVPNSLPVSF